MYTYPSSHRYTYLQHLRYTYVEKSRWKMEHTAQPGPGIENQIKGHDGV